MAKKKYAANYFIENIAQSIARDSVAVKKYSPEDRVAMYRELHERLEQLPELMRLLSLDHIHGFDNPWAGRIRRVAVVPPGIVVVDSRIQDMCSLPFWTYYGDQEGSFGRCAGVGAFSCCPPFTLNAEKVQALLDKSTLLFVLQTGPTSMMAGGDPGAQFRALNRLRDELNDYLGRGSVVQKFGGGPCFACFPDTCEGGGKCSAPGLKAPSLEGMGICVDQLCKDLCLLTGDASWKIRWIKGFGSPDQTPKRFKGTAALAVRLPS